MPGADTSTPIPTATTEPSDTPLPSDTPAPSDTPPADLMVTPTVYWQEPMQQPPPDCYTGCVRPQPGGLLSLFTGIRWDWNASSMVSNFWVFTGNLLSLLTGQRQTTADVGSYLAAWVDYSRCLALSWVTWCPQHTDAIAALPTQFANREPFASVEQVQQSIDAISTAANAYNWDNTGISVDGTPIADNDSPNWDTWQVAGNNPYNGGYIDITGQHAGVSGQSSTDCTFSLSPWVGPMLSEGMCFIFTTLDRLGILGWAQFFVDLMSVVIFVLYIYRRWINAGANSA